VPQALFLSTFSLSWYTNQCRAFREQGTWEERTVLNSKYSVQDGRGNCCPWILQWNWKVY